MTNSMKDLPTIKKHYFFPVELKDKRVFLRFEGVGAVAEVYVNGSLVTTHKGAYSAFHARSVRR